MRPSSRNGWSPPRFLIAPDTPCGISNHHGMIFRFHALTIASTSWSSKSPSTMLTFIRCGFDTEVWGVPTIAFPHSWVARNSAKFWWKDPPKDQWLGSVEGNLILAKEHRPFGSRIESQSTSPRLCPPVPNRFDLPQLSKDQPIPPSVFPSTARRMSAKYPPATPPEYTRSRQNTGESVRPSPLKPVPQLKPHGSVRSLLQQNATQFRAASVATHRRWDAGILDP